MAVKSKGIFAAFALSAVSETLLHIICCFVPLWVATVARIGRGVWCFFLCVLVCIFCDSFSFLPIAAFSCWGCFWEWTKKMPFCKPLARDCGICHSWRPVAVSLGSPEGTGFATLLFDVPSVFPPQCFLFFFGFLPSIVALWRLCPAVLVALFLCLPRVAQPLHRGIGHGFVSAKAVRNATVGKT